MHKKLALIGALCALIVVSALIPLSRLMSETSPLVGYLESKPLSPWSIMALSAAGEEPSLETLKSVAGSKAIDLEAPILALTAAGKDPRTFGSDDLVARLRSHYDGTQLGERDIVNDDIFGLLALIASGERKNDATVSGIQNFILAKQNGDGGFAFAVGGVSDTNTSSAALMALVAGGVPSEDARIQKIITYLASAQNEDGGIPYDPKSSWGTGSDASSDAWTVMALKSAGADVSTFSKNGATPLSHLATLKQESGAVLYQTGGAEDSFTPITTSYAFLALSGKTLPVRIITPDAPQAVTVSYRIEGGASTLCRGEGEATLALDTISLAKASCGIRAHITEASFGKYVDEIEGEKASGSSGWMYFVSAEMPSIGAGAYRVKQGDEVLWYYGNYGWIASRLRLAKSEVAEGVAVTGTVELFDNGWKPLEGATVSAGGTSATTDPQGAFLLALPSGRHRVLAEKGGYIRSFDTVTVGEPDKASIELEATLPGSSSGGGTPSGEPEDDAVTLLIEATGGTKAGSFGAMTPGSIAKQSLTIRNRGLGAVALSASVEGSSLFRRYLSLNARGWRNFGGALGKGAATTTEMMLSVPTQYSGSGKQTGTLIIWATPAAQQ